jgi:hypothetical protein
MMDYSNTYREIQTKIRELTDEEVEALLSFVQVEHNGRIHMASYDPAKDPFLNGEGLFEGSPDLAARDEEIMYGEDYPLNKADEPTK